MLYFSEIKTWETFKGKQDDFHLNYNSNSGGGQQRLAGSFFDSKGSLTPSSSLNGKYANFAFEINQPNGSSNLVQISSDNVTYQITTRGGESECVRLWVDGKDGKCNPSKALPAFLMLPPTCGVKKPSNLENSILSTSNYWLQSMWLKVDAMPNNKVLFKPIDCIVSGGIDKDGNGEQRFFAINFDQRFSDIIAIADDNQIDHDIRSAVNHFADIYKGVNVFNYDESTRVIANLMNYLFSRYFDRYSGTLDPLTFIRELSMSHKTPAPAKQTVLNQLVPHRGPRQLIKYGAPGTGKSHGIEEILGAYKDTIRTTFHPDSDYATFVGCYKPTMERIKKTYILEGKETEAKDDNGNPVYEDRIVYAYVPQAFAKAYVRAWEKMISVQNGRIEPQFLIVEEINRGNCAQIFGDLFQLLDRDDYGYSKYTIEADSDLAKYIASEFSSIGSGKLPDKIHSGAVLQLPPNFYIWATMNTSDQSLFPIDSAFKRRWEWKYIPISDAGKGWVIRVDATSEDDAATAPGETEEPPSAIPDGDAQDDAPVGGYDWWKFLVKINARIFTATQSEDKQLGYFFVTPSNGGKVISSTKFVNKVLFYLFNDVFKDCDVPVEFVKDFNNKEKFAFKDFFLDDGEVNDAAVKQLLDNLLKGDK